MRGLLLLLIILLTWFGLNAVILAAPAFKILGDHASVALITDAVFWQAGILTTVQLVWEIIQGSSK